ncbi:MAG: nuclear transport factor 2 family protein [Gammaproteobacteria bacterium]
MTRIALPLVTLALLMGSTTLFAANAATEVEAVERARFQTWLKGDVAAMRAVMADDALYCHASGQCQTKEEFIADIESKQRVYKKMDLISMKAKALGSYAVLINGTIDVVAEAPGRVAQFKGIYTSVYVRRKGHWQLISWQSTTLP